MAREKKGKKRIRPTRTMVKNGEFSLVLGPTQSCVIKCGINHSGLDRVVVTRESHGDVTVWAVTGPAGGSFSVERWPEEVKKEHPDHCDFVIDNGGITRSFEELLSKKFWGQFTFGELVEFNRKRKIIEREITRLVDEFEERAAERLNTLVGFER